MGPNCTFFSAAIGEWTNNMQLRQERPLFPHPGDRLTYQKRRIGAGPGPELLDAAAVPLGHVQIAFRIHIDAVDAPEPSGKIAPRAPRILEMALQVVLQH